MSIVNINMEALIETISNEDDNLGKSFLDTYTGEVIYIPTEVSSALEKGTLKEDTFDNWLKEFVSVAILISEDDAFRYLCTPILDDNFYISIMHKYIKDITSNSDLQLELNMALNSKEPIKKFEHVLMDKQDSTNGCETEEWYEYEDNCISEFVTAWIKSNGMDIKYLN